MGLQFSKTIPQIQRSLAIKAVSTHHGMSVWKGITGAGRVLGCVFLFFWLHWVFVAVRGLSLVGASGGFSCCGAWALGARAQ